MICSNECILPVLLRMHAQYMPHEHAEQVVGFVLLLLVLLDSYAMPIIMEMKY